MRLNESIVEDAALTWFREPGYAVGQTPDGQKVLEKRLDLIKMIQPPDAANCRRDQEAQAESLTTRKQQ